jgi:hypothetical protein
MSAGLKTSEFKMSAAVVFVGAALEATAAALHSLSDAGVTAPWFSSVLAVVGALMMVLTALGYTKGRSVVKATAPAPEVVVTSPLELIARVTELEAKLSPQTPHSPLPPQG